MVSLSRDMDISHWSTTAREGQLKLIVNRISTKRKCKKNKVPLLFSIFPEGNKWLILTRAGCCLNGPKIRKINKKFRFQFKIKLSIKILLGRLYLGWNTHISLNGFVKKWIKILGCFGSSQSLVNLQVCFRLANSIQACAYSTDWKKTRIIAV